MIKRKHRTIQRILAIGLSAAMLFTGSNYPMGTVHAEDATPGDAIEAAETVETLTDVPVVLNVTSSGIQLKSYVSGCYLCYKIAGASSFSQATSSRLSKLTPDTDYILAWQNRTTLEYGPTITVHTLAVPKVTGIAFDKTELNLELKCADNRYESIEYPISGYVTLKYLPEGASYNGIIMLSALRKVSEGAGANQYIAAARGTEQYNATIQVEENGQTVEKTATCTINVYEHYAKPTSAPTLNTKSATSVKLDSLGANYEYSKDGVSWQSSPEFTGLTPDTSYSFYCRFKDNRTEYYLASMPSEALSVTTDTSSVPVTAVEGVDISETSIKLISGEDVGVQLHAAVAPETATYQELEWSVDFNRATISSSGYVKVNTSGNSGKGTVTAQSVSNPNAKDTCPVIVYSRETTPTAPGITNKTSSSITLSSSNSGCVYKMNDGKWQTGTQFTNLKPNTEYTFYCKRVGVENPGKNTYTVDSLSSPGVKYKTFEAEATTKPATGVSLSPTTATLTMGTTNNTVSLSAQVLPADATNSKINYSSNKDTVATVSTTGVVTAAGPGVAVITAASDENATFAKTCTVTVYKPYETPAKPTVASKTKNSVTLTEVTGCEYSKDGTNWQTSTLFEGLAAGTTYRFYQRKKANTSEYRTASAASPELSVTTETGVIHVESISITSGNEKTLSATGSNQMTLLASVLPENASDRGVTWTSSDSNIATVNPSTGLVTGVAPGVAIITATTKDGGLTDTCTVTVKGKYAAPSEPTLLSKTYSKIVLNPIDGCEYSRDGGAWQTSNEFTGLAADTEYSFRARKKATTYYYVSEASPSAKFTTASAPTEEVPVTGVSVSAESATLDTISDQTIDLNETITPENATDKQVSWSSSNTSVAEVDSSNGVVTAVGAGQTTITVTTNDQNCTATCLITVWDTYEAPSAPEVASRTASSITLKTVAGCEYSKDGTTWQASPVFTNLNADTEYSFYQRKTKNDSAYYHASAASAVLRAKTAANTPQTVAVTGVKLNTASAELEIGRKVTIDLNETVEPANATDKTVSWKSDDASIASVDAKGVVTAKKAGRTNITVTTNDGKKTAVCEIKVWDTYAASLAPEVEAKTASSVTLKKVAGCEYSMDKKKWQSENVFSGLNGGTGYTFYQRKAADGYYHASPASAGTTVTTDTPSVGTIAAKGIYVMASDGPEIVAGMVADKTEGADYEYSWVATHDGGKTWINIQDWTKNYEWINWLPDEYGDYILICKARALGNPATEVSASVAVAAHPKLKGICQMPNADGGFLIGMETYDNQDYSYEMLILDCSLYGQGLPAWIYTTGKCKTSGNCLWTVWKPEYGYYWTLFRIYDKDGNMIDEQCFGFVNA